MRSSLAMRCNCHAHECSPCVEGHAAGSRARGAPCAGIPRPESEERWAAADRAIIGVWASKFNDRAFYSMRKVGLNFMDLRMAVLVQRVVPARYAFVIHTTNPSTGAQPRVRRSPAWAACLCALGRRCYLTASRTQMHHVAARGVLALRVCSLGVCAELPGAD